MAGTDSWDPGAGDGHWALPACRVLVVDRDHDWAEAQAILLETLGQEVRCAHDGDTALRTAIQFRPHLVLLDTGLPGMNGLEVARRLRILRPTRGARLVAQMDGPASHAPDPLPGFDGRIHRQAPMAELIAMLRATSTVAPEADAPLPPRPPSLAESDFFNCTIRD